MPKGVPEVLRLHREIDSKTGTKAKKGEGKNCIAVHFKSIGMIPIPELNIPDRSENQTFSLSGFQPLFFLTMS